MSWKLVSEGYFMRRVKILHRPTSKMYPRFTITLQISGVGQKLREIDFSISELTVGFQTQFWQRQSYQIYNLPKKQIHTVVRPQNHILLYYQEHITYRRVWQFNWRMCYSDRPEPDFHRSRIWVSSGRSRSWRKIATYFRDHIFAFFRQFLHFSAFLSKIQYIPKWGLVRGLGPLKLSDFLKKINNFLTRGGVPSKNAEIFCKGPPLSF